MNPALEHSRNLMAGLKPGDAFIHCFRTEQGFLFAYGVVTSIDDQGLVYSDYQTSSPLRPSTIGPYDQLVTPISRGAYQLAKMRGWPNGTDGVNQIIVFSRGNDAVLQPHERDSFASQHGHGA